MMILIIANIGTAVALFSLLRRQHENLALAFVTARVMESVFIAVGILSVLAIVTMRQDYAGDGGEAGLAAVGDALVAVQEWTPEAGAHRRRQPLSAAFLLSVGEPASSG